MRGLPRRRSARGRDGLRFRTRGEGFRLAGGNTFLDFCEDYRDCPFTSVIFSSDKNKFGDLASLAGRQIEIRGPITVYQGKPEIIIRDPGQIRLAP